MRLFPSIFSVIMSFVRRIFRPSRKITPQSQGKTNVDISLNQAVIQNDSALADLLSEPQKIQSIKDIDRIQALPNVKVKHIIDGDTIIVESIISQFKIRLDSIDCPEIGQEWGNISKRGLKNLLVANR